MTTFENHACTPENIAARRRDYKNLSEIELLEMKIRWSDTPPTAEYIAAEQILSGKVNSRSFWRFVVPVTVSVISLIISILAYFKR